MSKHTPGPWSQDTYGNIWGADGERLLVTGVSMPTGCHSREEEAKANARLIAAAPELLAACQEFVRKVEAGEARSTRSYEQMKAALAKADGTD